MPISNDNDFTPPQNLMEVQTYVNILQQIIQKTPRVSSVTAGVSEVSIANSQKSFILWTLNEQSILAQRVWDTHASFVV